MTDTGLRWGANLRFVVAMVAFAMTLYHLWTAAFGPPVREVHAPLHLCFAVTVLFLTPPDTGGLSSIRRIMLRSYDMLIMAIAIGGTAYLMLNADHIATRMLYVTPLTQLEMAVSAGMLFVILEAARRTIGWALVILAVVFLLYALFGNVLPGLLWHRGYSLNAIFEYSFFTPEGVYGVPVSVMANYVFHFVLFGSLLVASGAGDFFSNLANAMTARMTGGPAKASVVSSAFMGMLSGSAAANVVTTGSFTIPAMRRAGYNRRFAAAVEAVSSSGGQIAPPILGTAAFIMMEFTGVDYATILGISVIPAILYFLGVFVIVDLEARRLGLGIGEVIRTAPVLTTLRRQGYLLASVVVMLVILMDGWTPTMAAMGAIASLMVLLTLFDQTQRTRVHRVFGEAAVVAPKLIGPVTVACAVGGLLVGLIGLTGLGLRLSGLILDIASGNLLLILILTMVMGVILGMGMPTSGAYIILAALLAPGLVEAGVPLLAAHMFLIYSAAKSSITPPVAIASYAAAAISGSDPWQTSFTAFRLGLSVFIIPFMFAYGPALLGLGEPLEVGIAFVTASLGVIALSVACVGWMLRPITWPMRGLYFVTALLMINTTGISDLVGMAMLAALFLWAYLSRPRTQKLA
ncbi:TRAP transporter permease [Roseovarius sp.]|uniref:TRAP transporter permease n=1 Tax=Roseovarius sp. TaxID=1486281 RepID=UPI003569DC06